MGSTLKLYSHLVGQGARSSLLPSLSFEIFLTLQGQSDGIKAAESTPLIPKVPWHLFVSLNTICCSLLDMTDFTFSLNFSLELQILMDLWSLFSNFWPSVNFPQTWTHTDIYHQCLYKHFLTESPKEHVLMSQHLSSFDPRVCFVRLAETSHHQDLTLSLVCIHVKATILSGE